jgi:hypothetical protein
MGLFRKSIDHSKSSKNIDQKIKNLDEDLKKTGVSLDEVNVVSPPEKKTEEQKYDWRSTFDENSESKEDLTEDYVAEVREKHNYLAQVEGSIEYIKNKEVRKIFNELYRGEVEGVVEEYVSRSSEEIVSLREDLFYEINKTPKVDLTLIEDKLNSLAVKYNRLCEQIEKQSTGDPLLDSPVNVEQLRNHYQILVGRLQEQLASLGGGGEVRLEFLDDINRDSVKVDGKYLQYQASTGTWIGADASGGGGGSQTLDEVLKEGSSSSYGISVGVVTATTFVGDGSGLTGITASGTGVIIKDSGSLVGTAGTINFGDNVSVSPISAGVVTVTASAGTIAGIDTTGTSYFNNINATTITGSGSGLTNIPSAQLTGALPALDGSALTGVTATGTGIGISDSGSAVGTAQTINFGTGLSVSSISAGLVTVTSSGGVGIGTTRADGEKLNFGDDNDLEIFHSGVTGNIKNTTGTLILQSSTVRIQDAGSSQTAFSAADGVAKLYFENSEKLTTNTQGIDVTGHTETDTLNVSGVSTFQGNINLSDNDKLNFGDNTDLEIYHDGTESYIRDIGTGGLIIQGSNVRIQDGGQGETAFSAADGVAKLYFENSQKLETTNTGAVVTGILTATSFSGDGSNITGITTSIVAGDNVTVTTSNGISTIAAQTALPSRTQASGATGSIGAGTTTDITITGAKAYSLMKVGISSAAWVRLYTDTTSRTNDATRPYTTDPTPGSGVLAEVYTTNSGVSTFKMTPGVIGWNDDGTPSTNIYAKVTNNEGSSADITVTLTILKMEE